jgi:hypothetical protein
MEKIALNSDFTSVLMQVTSHPCASISSSVIQDNSRTYLLGTGEQGVDHRKHSAGVSYFNIGNLLHARL